MKLRFLALSFIVFSSNIFAQNNLTSLPNWQNLDFDNDAVFGISTEKAYEYLKTKKYKSNTVTVAIIDSGVEIDHPDLAANIWTNPNEIPANGIDDDHNGYTDDLHGWDYLGNKNGQDIAYETLELVREIRRYRAITEGFGASKLNTSQEEQLAYLEKLTKKLESKRKAIDKETANYFTELHQLYQKWKKVLETAFGKVPINIELLEKITLVSAPDLQEAKSFFQILDKMQMPVDQLVDGYNFFYSNLNYNLNEDYDPRPQIGDKVDDFTDKNYGNNEVEGPDAGHGTHVAGIIGAVRGNNLGIDGVANNVKLMILRAIPDGDERDKDVALAIRYAADNGAKIINMSFGKGYSPNKAEVDAAIKYAEAKNVLMVHAAGNDALNLDKDDNFPNAKYDGKSNPCSSWIEVGASSFTDAENLVAEFSNYGQRSVDVFAPGVSIYSCTPDSLYKENSGTSMAAPVVSGLAALLLSHFPSLTAVQLKGIIENSCIKPNTQNIKIPEIGMVTSFDKLSKNKGIVNTYNAVLKAELTVSNK
jgi:subtilisin family serine protease